MKKAHQYIAGGHKKQIMASAKVTLQERTRLEYTNRLFNPLGGTGEYKVCTYDLNSIHHRHG